MQALFVSNPIGEANFLASLDVRTKMFISATAAITVIFLKSVPALLLLVAISTLYMLSSRRWTVIAIAYLAIGLMWCVAIAFSYAMDAFLPRMGPSGVTGMMIPFLRSIVLINTVLAMALSSRIQGILSALKSLRLPYWLYICAAVMVRFLPSFLHDIKQIAETMKIRGHSFHPVPLALHPLRTIRLLFVPLIFRALRTSDELGIAAELKGVGYHRHTSRYRETRLARRDYALLASTVISLGAAVFVNLSTVRQSFMGM